jgi:23S rRNA (uracil1939-C5)-methyltransferase
MLSCRLWINISRKPELASSDLFFEISLAALAYGGEAIGRLPDGRAVFVSFALPGERVRIRLVEEKRGYARAELLEVLEAAPQRVFPRCPHFTVCGGCHYQHVPYPLQLEAKASILREQLERIGGLVNVQVENTVPSPHPWNYRNHIQFHLTLEGKLGFLSHDSRSVIPITECHLPEEAIGEIWPLLEVEPLPGLERVGLRAGADGDTMLVIESSSSDAPEFSVEELPVSAVHLSPQGSLLLAGSAWLEMDVLGRALRVSAASFFQVNTPMAEEMIRHLINHLEVNQHMTCLEMYCGVGLFSAFLAPRVGRLVGIESSPSACEDFVENLDEFENVELYEASTEAVLPSIDFRPDLILVDPPRSGLGRPVLKEILRLQAPVLAYISCDPATLARDARQLVEGGYRLEKITPFDLFPQTFHIESISIWKIPGNHS